MKNEPTLTLQQYLNGLDDFMGWCNHCGQTTIDGINPDASYEECPLCLKEQLFGMEEAFVRQLFVVE